MDENQCVNIVNRTDGALEFIEYHERMFMLRKDGPTYLFPIDDVCLVISIVVYLLRASYQPMTTNDYAENCSFSLGQ